MISRIVGITAALSLGANAFLLPPDINGSPDVSAVVDAGASAGINPKHQIIALPCAECAFPTDKGQVEEPGEHDDLLWIQGGVNSLLFDFRVTDDGRAVQLNGAPFYSMDLVKANKPENVLFTVEQVPSHADLAGILSGDVRSTTLRVTAVSIRETQVPAQDGDFISVLFGIDGLNDEIMRVDPVEARLLQSASGKLSIIEVIPRPDMVPEIAFPDFPPHQAGPGRVETPEEFAGSSPKWPPHHGRPHPHHHAGCTMLPGPLCRIKNMIDSKIDHAMRPGRPGQHGRPCPGRQGHRNHLPTHIKTHFGDLGGEEAHPRPHHGRPHHVRPHGGHHGQHGHHGHYGRHLLRAFAKGVVAVLIPVMAGIAVGMTVSLLGLLVGRLISLLWIQLVRGGRRGHANVLQTESVLQDGEDKAMLAEMEAPPMYEDAPAYERLDNEER